MKTTDMRIKTMMLGPIQTNCYLVYHETTKKGIIIDPADWATAIVQECRENGVEPEAILLTHGHGDHTQAADALRKQFGIPLIAAADEEKLLGDPSLNLTAMMGMSLTSLRADRLVRDGDVLELAGFRLRVIATPGHTAGSVCYLAEGEEALFSGDTLFEGSYGRTDFPTGSGRSLAESILKKLFALPDDTMVYPGHGAPTTIGGEKQGNPIFMYRRSI